MTDRILFPFELNVDRKTSSPMYVWETNVLPTCPKLSCKRHVELVVVVLVSARLPVIGSWIDIVPVSTPMFPA